MEAKGNCQKIISEIAGFGQYIEIPEEADTEMDPNNTRPPK